MKWYVKTIIAAVVAAVSFFVLTFAAYIANLDGKLIEVLYDFLIKLHDEKEVEEKI